MKMEKALLLMTLIMLAALRGISQDLASNSRRSNPENVIKGVIVNDQGEELPGVNVILKGTNQGTISDINGAYSIEMPSDINDPVLVFSFVGFDPKETQVGSQTIINVTLNETAMNLAEVVVTAFGVNKEKAKLGYSTQTVKGADLIKAREPNPINGLVGKVAGLTVGISPEMMGKPNILLRGNSNILYVVDGVPINSDTWNISPDDIESYTVLKGPNAAALYGFRGQNGAIIISTKRGANSDKGFSIDINSSTMIDKGFLTLPTTQNEYGIGSNYRYAFGDDPFDEDGNYRRAPIWGPRMEGQPVPQYNSPIDPETGVRQGTPFLPVGIDNYKRFAETGILTNNNIALGVKKDNADLRVSLSNSHQKGIFPNTSLNINNFNISAGYNFSKKLRFEGNINVSHQDSPNIPDVQYGPNSYAYSFGVYGGAHFAVEDLRDYWAYPGIPGVQQRNREYGRTNNPYFLAYEWLRGHKKIDTYGYAKLAYKFNDHLDISLRTQVTAWNALRTEKFPYSAEVYGRPDRKGDYTEDRRELFESNTDLLLNFNEEILPNLHLHAVAGGTIRNFGYNSSYLRTNNLVIPGIYNMANSENPLIGYNFNSEMLVLSGYSSVDLSYKNFLTLSATGHWDKLSTLPVGDQNYFYPSASISTVITDYWNLPKFISFAKARASYANVQGGLISAMIGPSYQPMGLPSPLSYGTDWYTTYEGPSYQNQNSFSTSLLYNNQPAANFTDVLANDALKPFSVTAYEAGMDLMFLENRLGLDVTYFRTINGPQIFVRDVAPSTGHSSRNINDVTTQKEGWEIALKGSPIITNDFKWNVLVNYATFAETFKEINDPSGTVFLNGAFRKVGDRVDEAYGRKFLRTPEGQIIHDAAGLPMVPPSGPAGNSSLGFGNSDFVWAIGNNFAYKNWNLGFQVDGRAGGKIFNAMYRSGHHGGTEIATATGAMGEARRAEWESLKANGSVTPAYVGEGVKLTSGTLSFDSEGNITNFDELTLEPNTTASQLQPYVLALTNLDEPWVHSKSFAKLREVVLTYNLPFSLMERTFIERASISLVGRNLLYFAEKSNMDIDQYPGYALNPSSESSNSNLQSASTRRFGINLNVTF